MKYTVIGGSGFIGSAMCNYLKNNNKNVFIPERDYHFSAGEDLGIVFYCAGYGDCINNYDNVIDANVLLLRKILNNVKFKKLVYVSSTRVYMNENCAKENADLLICHNGTDKILFHDFLLMLYSFHNILYSESKLILPLLCQALIIFAKFTSIKAKAKKSYLPRSKQQSTED